MLVAVPGLVGAEMARVEQAGLGMDARSRTRVVVQQEADDERVRGADAARELQRVAPGVAALGGERVLIEGHDRRTVLLDAAPNAVGEDLGRVGEVPDDLDRGPVAELRRAQAIGGDRPDDARDRRRVVREREGAVLVVGELIQRATP